MQKLNILSDARAWEIVDGLERELKTDNELHSYIKMANIGTKLSWYISLVPFVYGLVSNSSNLGLYGIWTMASFMGREIVNHEHHRISERIANTIRRKEQLETRLKTYKR